MGKLKSKLKTKMKNYLDIVFENLFYEEVISTLLFSAIVIILVTHLNSIAQTEISNYNFKPNHQTKLALFYAIQSYSKPELAQTEYNEQIFKILKNTVNSQIEEKHISNYSEYESDYYKYWELTGVESLDQAWLSSQPFEGLKIYKSLSPRVQRKIDWDQNSQIEFVRSHLIQYNPQFLFLENSFEHLILPQIIFNSLGTASNSRLTDNQIQMASKFFTDSVHSYLDQNLNSFESSIANALQQMQSTTGSDKNEKILIFFVKELFSNYFKNLSLQDKKNIAFQILCEGSSITPQRQFEILVMNSGPQLQKLLQVIAQQKGFPEEIQSLFKKLENQSKPAPEWYVRKILNDAKFDFEILNLELKPLGVGTMAQVHRAKIRTNFGEIKNVVIRFLKPGIKDKVEQDHQILKNIAASIDKNKEFQILGAPKLSPLIDDISNTVRNELFRENTIQLQIKAKSAYEKSQIIDVDSSRYELRFVVPEVISAPEPFLVQSMAFGKKIDKATLEWLDVAPNLKKSIVESLAQLWVEELLFKSGLYHSDLHQGNFLVQVSEPEIRVSLLDFGMGGIIDNELQKNLIRLGAAIAVQKPSAIAEFLWLLFENTETKSKAEFTKQLNNRFLAQKVSSEAHLNQSVSEWLTWSINEGYVLKYHMVNLNRGLIILERLLKDSGSKMTLNSIAKKISFKYPKQTSKILFSTPYLAKSELLGAGFSLIQEKIFGKSNFEFKISEITINQNYSMKCEALFN